MPERDFPHFCPPVLLLAFAAFLTERLLASIKCRMKRLLTFLLLVCPLCASAEEWPMWRGPAGNGHSSETAIPLHWSNTENVAWKVPIPGKGHSSPIIWGDRIFLTTAIEQEQKRMLLCLSRLTGKTLWERQVLIAPLEQKNSLNNYASATPATDGQR